MKRLKFLLLILGILLIASCREKSPSKPPDKNRHPQVDIPWPSLADSPWPMHHHDPQSTGRSPYVGPQQGKVAWKFNVGAPVGTSVAIGPDSTIYFASSYEMYEGKQVPFLYALDWNGNLKWKFKLRLERSFADASQACSPLVAADGTIYIGSRDHLLYAINPDGTLKWTFQADDDIYPISITIDLDGKLYFTAADNFLYSVNPDGTLNWKSGGDYKFLCSPLAGISISPNGSTLYLGTTDNRANCGLIAVDLTGKVKWLFPSGLIDGTPVVDNDGNIFFATEDSDTSKSGIFSVNPEGRLRWKYTTQWVNNYDLTMDYDGNVYFCSGEGGSYFLVSCDHEGFIRWKLDLTIQNHLRSSLICDREGTTFMAVGSPHQNFFAVTSDGDIKWQNIFGEVNGNSPAISKGRLLMGTWYRDPGREFYSIN